MALFGGNRAVALIGLLALVVLANLLYCAAYVVDVFVHLSGFQEAWRRNRWILLVFGCLFASGLVYAVCSPIM